MIAEIDSIYFKTLNVLKSVKTPEQAKSAIKYADLCLKNYYPDLSYYQIQNIITTIDLMNNK